MLQFFAEVTIGENSQLHDAAVVEVLKEMKRLGSSQKGRCRRVVEEFCEVLFQAEREGIVEPNLLREVV